MSFFSLPSFDDVMEMIAPTVSQTDQLLLFLEQKKVRKMLTLLDLGGCRHPPPMAGEIPCDVCRWTLLLFPLGIIACCSASCFPVFHL